MRKLRNRKQIFICLCLFLIYWNSRRFHNSCPKYDDLEVLKILFEITRMWSKDLVEGVVDEEKEGSVKSQGRDGSHSEDKGWSSGCGFGSFLCDLNSTMIVMSPRPPCSSPSAPPCAAACWASAAARSLSAEKNLSTDFRRIICWFLQKLWLDV